MADDMNSKEYASLSMTLGEVKGQLNSISDLIRHSNEATNQRIDDLSRQMVAQTAAINTRIEDHRTEVDERFKAHEKRLTAVETSRGRARIETAGGATLVVALVEIIRKLVP